MTTTIVIQLVWFAFVWGLAVTFVHLAVYLGKTICRAVRTSHPGRR